MHLSIAHPIRLTVGVDQARKLIKEIPHDTCRRAAERHWNAADGTTTPEESVNCSSVGAKPAWEAGLRPKKPSVSSILFCRSLLPGTTSSSITNTLGCTGTPPRPHDEEART